MAYWLIIETVENWHHDKQSGFMHFGMPAHKRKMAEKVREGDTLVTYVTKISAFSDTRSVSSNELISINKQEYDHAYYDFAISTKPSVVLEEDQWIKVHSLLDKLNLTKDMKDWRFAFRQTMRRLTDEDGEYLVQLISKEASKAPIT